MIHARRGGFTVVELVIATVLLGLVTAGLYQVQIQQRRFTDWQRSVTESHDGFRVANSILSADLREAVISDGDVVLFASDSVAIRSALGLGFVCAKRGSPKTVALSREVGRMPLNPGDSMLAQTTGGWRSLPITSREVPGRGGLRCLYGNPAPDFQFRPGGGLADSISVGAPVHVYRRVRYHLVQEAGETWLGRTDTQGTQALVGPLSAGGVRFRMLDAAGQPTSAAPEAVGVEVRLVMQGPGGAVRSPPDTLVMLFQGRNR